MKVYFLFAAALMLGSIFPLQAQSSRSDAEMQRRHLREFQRYQRHYEEQLVKFRADILEKDENLQFHYSSSIDSERLYLEVSDAYEELLVKKMATLPNTKIIQDAVAKAQKDFRKPGQSPTYYRQQLANLRAAQIKLGRLRESLKEDEEVKLAFDEMDALQKKYLAESKTYEDLMAKAMANHEGAKRTQVELDKTFQQFVLEKTRRGKSQPKR